MNKVAEKADRRYRSRISDYLGSDDYKLIELEIKIHESVDDFEDTALMDFEIEPRENPEQVTLKVVMIKKS